MAGARPLGLGEGRKSPGGGDPRPEGPSRSRRRRHPVPGEPRAPCRRGARSARLGAAAGANFFHRGSGEERRRDPGPGMAARGFPLAGCRGQSLRTPTPAKSGSGGDGPRLRGQVATTGEEQGATTRAGAAVSRGKPDAAACRAHAQSRSGEGSSSAPGSPQRAGMGCGHTGCIAAAKTPTH